MKAVVKNYADWILGGVALVVGGLLIYMFIWGGILIIQNMDRAFGTSNGTTPDPRYEIEKARQLDYRGLNQI